MNTVHNVFNHYSDWTDYGDLSTNLSESEKKLLTDTSRQINTKLEKIFRIKVNTVFQSVTSPNTTSILPADHNIFVPSGYFRVDLNKETAKDLCNRLNVDAVASVQIEFIRNRYDQFPDGVMNRIQAKGILKLYDQTGEMILSDEIMGESKTALREDDIVNFVMGAEKMTDLKQYYTFKSNFGPLFKEALDDFILKLSNRSREF